MILFYLTSYGIDCIMVSVCGGGEGGGRALCVCLNTINSCIINYSIKKKIESMEF